MITSSIFVVLLFACSAQPQPAAHDTDRTVRTVRTAFSYGRGDYVLGSKAVAVPQLATAAQASAIVVDTGSVVNGELRLKPRNFCPGLRIAMGESKTAKGNICSAARITATRAVTAAHCLDGFKPGQLSLAFGFHDQGKAGKVDVRKITRYLYCRYDKYGDVAVVEFEGTATKPLPIHTLARQPTPTLAVNDAVHLASYPGGLALRMSTCIGGMPGCNQATVRWMDAGGHWFRGPLDGAAGSSGAAVVDDDQYLVGIQHGGDRGFSTGPNCIRETCLDEGCRGQWISRVDKLPAALFDDGHAAREVACLIEPPDLDYDCDARSCRSTGRRR